MYKMCVLLLIFLLSSCGTRTTLAPVVELKWQSKDKNLRTHRVRANETLYAIAFRYDLDYRQLAAMNHLSSPYAIRVGQTLRIRSDYGGSYFSKPPRVKTESIKTYTQHSVPKKFNKPYSTPNQIVARQNSSGQWIWPVKGRVTAHFVPQQGKKGIDIAGTKGEKIYAATNGIVAYAGSGLSGYGNLVIIKHNDRLLTAYGNNSRNIVKEGQKVKAGQIIAEIGVIDRKYWGVHFEVRQDGKPVNPLNYLRKS